MSVTQKGREIVARELDAKAERILESGHRAFYQSLASRVRAGACDDRKDVREASAK